MTRCEVCGNDYDKTIEIVVNGVSRYFDCFECAIHALAPECEHCGCKIIGHGVEAAGTFFLLRALRARRGRGSGA